MLLEKPNGMQQLGGIVYKVHNNEWCVTVDKYILS